MTIARDMLEEAEGKFKLARQQLELAGERQCEEKVGREIAQRWIISGLEDLAKAKAFINVASIVLAEDSPENKEGACRAL